MSRILFASLIAITLASMAPRFSNAAIIPNGPALTGTVEVVAVFN